MSEEDTYTHADDVAQTDGAAEMQPQRQRSRRIPMALVSFVATVTGWMLLPFIYQLSLGAAIVGFVSGIIGWRARRGAWRNLSITCTVASGTLLLVFITFWSVIYWLGS